MKIDLELLKNCRSSLAQNEKYKNKDFYIETFLQYYNIAEENESTTLKDINYIHKILEKPEAKIISQMHHPAETVYQSVCLAEDITKNYHNSILHDRQLDKEKENAHEAPDRIMEQQYVEENNCIETGKNESIKLKENIMKKCKKCFLSPEMCGAENDEKKCERIYDNKWKMQWEIFKEYAKPTILFVLLLIFLIMGAIALSYYNQSI